MLAATPPLGWNSYDCYGSSVTEDEVRANAEFMAQHMHASGWEYIVIDCEWYDPTQIGRASPPKDHAAEAIDGYGRLQPAVRRFPSAAVGAGLRPLGDSIHSLGLKFGIHMMRGIPRRAAAQGLPVLGAACTARDIALPDSACAWNQGQYGVNMRHPGGQAYYDSVISQYADWGVDFIKADDMSSPYHADEIEGVARAIRKSGQPIVLSLSPGDTTPLPHAAHLVRYCESWRISADFWDRWADLKRQFDLCRDWAPHAGPGHWPDADMLPLGRLGPRPALGDDRATRFTADEQRTILTLWSISRSPLMVGTDLPTMGAETLALLTNAEVLAVNQNGTHPREFWRDGDHIVWCAEIPDSSDRYLAVFNAGDESPASCSFSLAGLGHHGTWAVRDLWSGCDRDHVTGEFKTTIVAHATNLYRLHPMAG